MKGKSVFTSSEIRDIKEQLLLLEGASITTKKFIGSHLRQRYQFYISDFTRAARSFKAQDLERLIKEGRVSIGMRGEP